jgi:hypothetical protein
MVHYSLIKMTSQMVFTLLVKKDHPTHTEYVKINLSKITHGLFSPCPNLVFLPKLSILKTKNFSSDHIYVECMMFVSFSRRICMNH